MKYLFILMIFQLFRANVAETFEAKWENNAIVIELYEDPNPYFLLPIAKIYKNNILVNDPEMYYIRGVNHTSTSRISTNYLGEYNIDYQVICPTFGYKSTVSINFKIVDKIPPVFVQVLDVTIEVSQKLPDLKIGVIVTDNYYPKEQITINVNSNAVNTSVVGTYNVIYLALDPSSNTTTYIAKVYVVDSQSPDVIEKKPLELEVNTTLKISDYFTVKDNYSQLITSVINDEYVDYHNVGEYPISFNFMDTSKNVTIIERIIKIVDTQPPKITPKTYIKPIPVFEDITRDLLEGYILSITDNYSILNISDLIITHDIENNIVGTYNIFFKVFDQSNNHHEITVKVNVIDDIPPTIELLFELIFDVGSQSVFIEDYLLISDNYCRYSDLTIKIDSKYNINVVGRYPIEVVVTDLYKNTTKYHDYIECVDRIGPTIVQEADIIIIDFLKKSFSGYFSLTDNYSKPEKLKLIYLDEEVIYDTIGIYPLYVYGIDEANNETLFETYVYVMDVIPPTINLVNGPVYLELHNNNFDIYSLILSVYDNVDILEISNVTAKSNINYNKIGEYVINYTLIDNSLNQTTTTFLIYVDDTIPPIVDYENITIKTTDSFDILASINIIDDLDYRITTIPEYIDSKIPGVKEILYLVTDLRGNTTKFYRTITIIDSESTSKNSIKNYIPLGLVVVGCAIAIGIIIYLERR